jgi:CRP-like cAMP-binding protein
MSPAQENFNRYIQAVFPMPSQLSETITGSFHSKEFPKGEFFLTEGKVSDEYCFIDQGFMRAFTFDPEGNEVTTAFFSEGQLVIDLPSFFKRLPAGENIQAITDCHGLSISFEEIQVLFHSVPQFREFGRTVLVNAYAQLKTRTLSMIRENAEQRYTGLLKTNPAIFQHAPLKHIASYLGVTDTSLSRIRKEFSKNNSD